MAEQISKIKNNHFCPKCDTIFESTATVRKGDICPECLRGYIN
jgi:ribosomal protein S27AE